MNKYIVLLVSAAAFLLTSGCRPDEGLWWAPGGTVAAVRATDGLRMTSANGELSAPVLPREIQSVSWLRDGSAFVVSRRYTVADWKSAESLIAPTEAAAARELARAMPDLLKAGLTASGGSWDDIEEKFLKPLGLKGDIDTIFRAAAELHRDKMLQAIAAFPNAKKLEQDLLGDTNGIQIFEITLMPMRNEKPAEPKAILRSLRPLLDPVVSSHQSLLAYRTGDGALKARALDGTNDVVVADDDANSAIWSIDGRSLIYVVLRENGIGEIRTRTVVNGDGKLFSNGDVPNSQTLAMAALDPAGPRPRLHAMPDGRILFASVSITLPASLDGISPNGQLFLLDVTKPGAPIVPIKITEGSLPADLNAFAVSPDGRWIAVVEAGTDAVAVLEVSTGKVQIISPAHNGWKSRLVPAWRNNSELTFAAFNDDAAKRPILMIWQAGGQPRALTKNWPDEVVKDWLEGP
jgi:hypothetical protein